MRTSPQTRTDPTAGAASAHNHLVAVPDPEPERHPRVDPYWTAIVIRPAVAADEVGLWRLAELDSANRPDGQMVVAEQAGSLVAAVSLSDGASIADPFRATADVVELLRMRAAQLQKARVKPAAPARRRVPALLGLAWLLGGPSRSRA